MSTHTVIRTHQDGSAEITPSATKVFPTLLVVRRADGWGFDGPSGGCVFQAGSHFFERAGATMVEITEPQMRAAMRASYASRPAE